MALAYGLSTLHTRFDNLDSDTKKKVLKVSASVVGLIAAHKVCTYAYNYIDDHRIRERKLNQTQTTKGKLLQKLVGLKQPIDNRDVLTKLSYEEIRDRLRRNDLKVIDLLEAFQAKALEVDRSLNCISDIIYDADVTALYLDSLPQENRGRLHGIPLSVKDCINQAGHETNYGCISRTLKAETNTAAIVEALANEGMVPFARTTMTQGGVSIGGHNPIFGETLNPQDRKRTSGGSSAGEGALIGGGGSIIGLGTDIAGSIRIPASFCGIYGFKPTEDRIGSKGMLSWQYRSTPATYSTTYGPMSSDFDLLVDVMKVLCSPALFNLNEKIPMLHFDSNTYESSAPLKIGVYKSFSDTSLCLESVPAVKRAIEVAKTALESRGHTVIEWEPPRIGYACDLLLRCLFPDGGKTLLALQASETSLSNWTKTLCKAAFLSQLQIPFVKTIACGIQWLRSPLTSKYLMKTMNLRYPIDLIMLTKEANNYKEEVARSWREAGLDGVICPVLPVTAPLIDGTGSVVYGDLYCNLYNFLSYPAGVVPVTHVTVEDDQQLQSTYRNDRDHRRAADTQVGSVGMPVCVQCVAQRWQDEKCLRIMKEIKAESS